MQCGLNGTKSVAHDNVPVRRSYQTGFVVNSICILVVIVLAILGLGWKTFTSGVITGFEKAIDIGTPIIKNLTQEAKEYVNSPEQLSVT